MRPRALLFGITEDLSRVFADPLYRSFFLILVVQGVALGAAFPFVPLWAALVLHLDATQNGLLQTVTGIVGVVFGLAVGALSDGKLQRRRWILGTLVAGILGWVGLAFANEFVLGALFYALTRVAQWGLIFALVGDWLRHRQTERPAGIHNAVRMGFALGWGAGPSIAGNLIGAVGYPGLFLMTGGLQLFTLAYGWRCLRDAPVSSATHSPTLKTNDSGRVGYAPLVIYTAAIFCSYAAGPSRFLLLPLFITEKLNDPVSTVGLLFTIAVLFELPLFLVVGRLADRYGGLRLLMYGLTAQVLYFAGLTFAQSFPQLVLLEPLFAFTVATTNGIGMLQVQSLLPRRAGTALAIYNLGSQFGPVISAPALGYVADHYGWQGAFAGSTGLALVAVLTLVGSKRRLGSPSESEVDALARSTEAGH